MDKEKKLKELQEQKKEFEKKCLQFPREIQLKKLQFEIGDKPAGCSSGASGGSVHKAKQTKALNKIKT